MKKFAIILAPMILILSGCGTEAPGTLEVNKSLQIDSSLESVWDYAGDFCAISVWHPAVETCEISEEDGATYRILTLGDGAQIKERHDGETATGYSYTIIEGPLPVKDYSSTFQAEGDAVSATINWSSTFMAEGATDDEAVGVITGVYDGGLSTIAEHFSQ
ncbi:MAG: SRPBCC family protein [Gammaproteobacteria bacterium]|nr:SRPBCC family protein [Gammaproteobacteria bacterium]